MNSSNQAMRRLYNQRARNLRSSVRASFASLIGFLLVVLCLVVSGCSNSPIGTGADYQVAGRFTEPNGRFSARFPAMPFKVTNYVAGNRLVTWQAMTLIPRAEYAVCSAKIPSGYGFDNEGGMDGYVKGLSKELKYYMTERTQFRGRSALKISGEHKSGRAAETYLVRAGRVIFVFGVVGGPENAKQQFLDSIRLNGKGAELFVAPQETPLIWAEHSIPGNTGMLGAAAKFPSEPKRVADWRNLENTTAWTAKSDWRTELTVVRFENADDHGDDLEKVYARMRETTGCPSNAMERQQSSTSRDVEWIDDDGITLHRLRLVQSQSTTFGLVASTTTPKHAADFVKGFRLAKPKSEEKTRGESLNQDAIARALASKNEIDVAHALQKLRRISPTKGRPAITGALNGILRGSEVASHRSTAAQFLVGWGNRESTRLLVAALDDPDRSVKKAAHYAVAVSKSRAGRRELIYRLDDFRSRRLVEGALLFAGESIVPDLGRFVLSNADASTRADACRILGKMGSRSAIGYLKRAENNDEFFVRCAAERASKELQKSIRRQQNLSRL